MKEIARAEAAAINADRGGLSSVIAASGGSLLTWGQKDVMVENNTFVIVRPDVAIQYFWLGTHYVQSDNSQINIFFISCFQQ